MQSPISNPNHSHTHQQDSIADIATGLIAVWEEGGYSCSAVESALNEQGIAGETRAEVLRLFSFMKTYCC